MKEKVKPCNGRMVLVRLGSLKVVLSLCLTEVISLKKLLKI